RRNPGAPSPRAGDRKHALDRLRSEAGEYREPVGGRQLRVENAVRSFVHDKALAAESDRRGDARRGGEQQDITNGRTPRHCLLTYVASPPRPAYHGAPSPVGSRTSSAAHDHIGTVVLSGIMRT